jgi:hypothetical protein
MALLGVVRPGNGTLQDLHDMYTTPPEPLMPASRTTTPQSAATPDDVRYAYYSGPGSSWDLWVREMYIDPPELIVENDADRTLLRVPYTCLSDGTITFGESQTVTIQYVAARAATPDARQMAFSSKAEARHGIPHTPAAAPAPGPAAAGGTSTTKEEVGMPDTLIEGLRKLVGTADDADEATVLSAVTEALSEQVTETPDESAEFQVPEGMVLMPAAAVADLQEAAKTTKVLAETAAKQERDAFLDANRTKYLPASRAAWEQQYKVDPEGTKAYFSSAPEIVPVSAVGHSADPAAVEDDGWFDGFGTPNVKVG